MNKPSFRDAEQLSAYLDGELNQVKAARLKTRIEKEPALAGIYNEISQSRALMRRLPQRHAPRNFILTPKMVAKKPPLPRAYPFFQFSTALATLLLVFTFALNAISPLSLGAMAPAPDYGLTGGMGGGPAEESAMLEEPAMAMEEAPAPAPEAALPAMTEIAPPAAEDNRVAGTPTPQAKQGVVEQAPAEPEVMPLAPFAEVEAPARQTLIPAGWQVALALLAFGSALILFLMRKNAASRWRK